jgi:NAD(P)-dependent dehydrogenase (short-subunit alcohol dehydrogenase family)
MEKQYAKLISQNLQSGIRSCHSLGQLIQEGIENTGFETSFLTEADWGYVFRINKNKKSFDISIIGIQGCLLGVAIEPTVNIIYKILNVNEKGTLATIKEEIQNILVNNAGVEEVVWFTKDEWKQAFGTDFFDTTEN